MHQWNFLNKPDGKLERLNVSKVEFQQAIATCSLIGVRTDGDPISEGILWFKHGFSAHLMIYLGGGSGFVGSSEGSWWPFKPSGFILRRLDSHFNVPGKCLRVYANSRMTVAEMEVFKARAYDLMSIQQGYGNYATELARKAWYEIQRRLGIKPAVKPEDTKEPVCNVACMQIYQPRSLILPRLQITAPGLSEELAGPSDTDDYMATPEAKAAGWYIRGEWRNERHSCAVKFGD